MCAETTKRSSFKSANSNPIVAFHGNRAQAGPTEKESGFVLLIVLAVLTVMSALTGTLAWTVSTKSLCTNARVSQSQNSYAMAAAINVLANNLETSRMGRQIKDTGFAHGTIQLGPTVVFYWVWDEASKYKYVPGGNQALPGSLQQMGVRLRPSQGKHRARTNVVLFEDVFEIELDQLSRFYGPSSKGKAVVDILTLWSDGRLNVNSASDDALRLHLKELNTTALERLLQLRQNTHIDDLKRFVSMLQVNRQDTAILLARLTTRTSRMSVRLVCQGKTLRSDAFAIFDLEASGPVIRLWRDLPPTGKIPDTDGSPDNLRELASANTTELAQGHQAAATFPDVSLYAEGAS